MVSVAVCRTCPRGDPVKGTLAPILRQSYGDRFAAAEIALLMVECLGGCPRPCTAAFDAPDKTWRVRFTGLGPQHAEDLLEAALVYAGSADGGLEDSMLPPGLRGRISARSPKRVPPPAGPA